MRDLDRAKKYDLSQLNDEQLQGVLDWLKENDTGWDNSHMDKLKSSFCILYDSYGEWKLKTSKSNETNALELFEEELKTYQITEYSTGDFGDLGIKQGTIKATNKDQAWLFHKESNGFQEQEKGFFSFVEVKEEPEVKTLPSIYKDVVDLSNAMKNKLEEMRGKKNYNPPQEEYSIVDLDKAIRNIKAGVDLLSKMPEAQENIYERADKLMQDGKQHGLKIVVTFEKL